MNAMQEYETIYNSYPRDVTSPGPDQRLGIICGQPTEIPPVDPLHQPQFPTNGDKQNQPPQEKTPD